MSVRLRRGLPARFASSTTQCVLTMLCGFAVYAIGYGAVGDHPAQQWSLAGVIGLVVLFVPWLAGITAWARVDDAGLHWRYWLTHSYRWDEIGRIILTRRDPLLGRSASYAAYTILVHPTTVRSGSQTDDVSVRPVEAVLTRSRRAFADALVEAARRHGTRVTVTSPGWNQPMPDGADEKLWI